MMAERLSQWRVRHISTYTPSGTPINQVKFHQSLTWGASAFLGLTHRAWVRGSLLCRWPKAATLSESLSRQTWWLPRSCIYGVHLLVTLPQLYSLAPSKDIRPYVIRAELYRIVRRVWEKAAESQVKVQFLLFPPPPGKECPQSPSPVLRWAVMAVLMKVMATVP